MHVWGRGEVHVGFSWENVRERDHLQDVGIYGRIILKLRSALFWDLTPRNNPEERRSHQHRGGSLKSRLILELIFKKSIGRAWTGLICVRI
jgi:hypothetical protein